MTSFILCLVFILILLWVMVAIDMGMFGKSVRRTVLRTPLLGSLLKKIHSTGTKIVIKVMSIQVLKSVDGFSVIYCPDTMKPIGPVFAPGISAELFLHWLGADPRSLPEDELVRRYYRWLGRAENQQG